MKLVAYEGRDKRAVYVNPALVTFVREVNDRTCTIYFGAEHSVEVSLQAKLVVDDLRKALQD